MDELCDLFDSVVPVHDAFEEGNKLEYSIRTPLAQLAENTAFIANTGSRYSKYLKYTNLISHGESGVVIQYLMQDFNDTDKDNTVLLAVKIKVIDNLIYNLL